MSELIGVLGGTSFLQSHALRNGEARRVVTPWAAVEVVLTDTLAMISRHGPGGTIPPHSINHHAHLAALHQLAVRGVVSFGSVGSLTGTLPPGSQALIHDFYSPHRAVSFHSRTMAVTIPTLDIPWRSLVLDTLTSAGCSIRDGGVYAETPGLRFETVTEIRALAGLADVVGMTCASEATLAMELGLPIAILATVDNHAHGLGLEPLTGDAFAAQVLANRARVEKALAAVSVMTD